MPCKSISTSYQSHYVTKHLPGTNLGCKQNLRASKNQSFVDLFLFIPLPPPSCPSVLWLPWRVNQTNMALVPRRIVVSRSVPVVASAPAGKCRVISSKAARPLVSRASSTSTNAAAGPRIDPATIEKLPSHAWWPERLAKLQASDAVSVVGPQEAYDLYKECKSKIVVV